MKLQVVTTNATKQVLVIEACVRAAKNLKYFLIEVAIVTIKISSYLDGFS